VTKSDAALHRKAITPRKSAGSPKRPAGVRLITYEDWVAAENAVEYLRLPR
jgi:hypothetical protein